MKHVHPAVLIGVPLEEIYQEKHQSSNGINISGNTPGNEYIKVPLKEIYIRKHIRKYIRISLEEIYQETYQRINISRFHSKKYILSV